MSANWNAAVLTENTVVLCEKPDQARKHAELFGIAEQGRGFIKARNGWTFTYAIGHLAELLTPDEMDPKYKRWELSTLPIIPTEWRFKPIAEKKDQFQTVVKLLKPAKTIVIATDCGREGELIARILVQQSGNTKHQLKRFWSSSLDQESLKNAWHNLKDGHDYDTLFEESILRQRCDWLWGMNLTRAATLTLAPPKVVYPIGRVQTTVSGLMVRRHLAIKNFVSKDFFELTATVATAKGPVRLRYAPKDETKRIYDSNQAQALASQATGATGPLHVENNPRRESPPPFPRLSDLQKEANKRWNWSLYKTLDIAQELYDADYASYPRSDSTKVPTEQLNTVGPILEGIIGLGVVPHLNVTGVAQPVLRKDRFIPEAQLQNEADHHAIIPTLSFPSIDRLSEDQAKLYAMIAFWFIRAVSPDYEYNECVVAMNANGVPLRSIGKTPLKMGFKALSMKHAADADAEQDAPQDDTTSLPALSNGEPGRVDKVDVDAKKTTPPAYYTEASLLEDMISIHKFVDNPAYKARLSENAGIGTEATRAATIKELRKRKFIIPRPGSKKQIDASPETIEMIQRIPPQLIDPALTAVWEEYMSAVRHGRATFSDCMNAITTMLVKHVTFFQNMGLNAARSADETARESKLEHNGHTAKCPDCGKPMGYRVGDYGGYWSCTGYPACKTRLKADAQGKPLPRVELTLGETCPKCKKKPLALRDGPRGKFWACTGFPKCKHSEPALGDKATS